jgi:hypothetical protein
MIDLQLLLIQTVSFFVSVLWCIYCIRLLIQSRRGVFEHSWRNLGIGGIMTAVGIGFLTWGEFALSSVFYIDAIGGLITAAGAAFKVLALGQQFSLWGGLLSSQESKRILESFAIAGPIAKTATAARRGKPDTIVQEVGASTIFNGLRILVEYDPTSDYDDFLGRRVERLLYKGSTLTIFTKQGSVLSGLKAVKLVLLSFSEQSIKLGAGGNLTVSITNPSLILETFASIVKSNPNETVIVDNLTDLTINLGFERAYNLLQGMAEMLAGTMSNLLFLFNPKAHDEKITAAFEGYCNVILRYDKNGLRTEKGVIDLPFFAEG